MLLIKIGLFYNFYKTNIPFIDRQINKQSVLYPYDGIVLIHRKEWNADTHCNVDELQKHPTTLKGPPIFLFHFYEIPE